MIIYKKLKKLGDRITDLWGKSLTGWEMDQTGSKSCSVAGTGDKI
jgi:hypothetical protein